MRSIFEFFWLFFIGSREGLQCFVSSLWSCGCLAVLGAPNHLGFTMFSVQFPFDPGAGGGWLSRSSGVLSSWYGESSSSQRVRGVLLMLSWFSLQWSVLVRRRCFNFSRPYCGIGSLAIPWFQVCHVAQEMKCRLFVLKTLMWSFLNVRMLGAFCVDQACILIHFVLQEVYQRIFSGKQIRLLRRVAISMCSQGMFVLLQIPEEGRLSIVGSCICFIFCVRVRFPRSLIQSHGLKFPSILIVGGSFSRKISVALMPWFVPGNRWGYFFNNFRTRGSYQVFGLRWVQISVPLSSSGSIVELGGWSDFSKGELDFGVNLLDNWISEITKWGVISVKTWWVVFKEKHVMSVEFIKIIIFYFPGDNSDSLFSFATREGILYEVGSGLGSGREFSGHLGGNFNTWFPGLASFFKRKWIIIWWSTWAIQFDYYWCMWGDLVANILKIFWVAFETLNVVGGLCFVAFYLPFWTYCLRGGYEIFVSFCLVCFFLVTFVLGYCVLFSFCLCLESVPN